MNKFQLYSTKALKNIYYFCGDTFNDKDTFIVDITRCSTLQLNCIET